MIQTVSITAPESFFGRSEIRPEFAWWYLDVLDDHGNGAVCIVSKGLPFLPTTSIPRSQRHSLNCVVYRNGREAFYLLQEYNPEQVSYTRRNVGNMQQETWCIGNSTFRRTLDFEGATPTVSLEGELKVGEGMDHQLIGSISTSGTLIQGCPSIENSGMSVHQWTPLMTHSTADVDLDTISERHQFTGSVYHDSNISLKELSDLNIDHWWWARVSLCERTWIVYLVYPADKAHPSLSVASVDTDGQWTSHKVESVDVKSGKKSVYGLTLPKGWTLHLSNDLIIELSVSSWLDDSPFYQRVLVSATIRGEHGRGYLEHVVPTKLGIPWQQPFVRMKTHFQEQPSSFFTPLFTGPAASRWSRQLSRCLPF